MEARTYTLRASRTDGIQSQLLAQAITLAPGKAYTLVLRGSDYPNAVAPERIAFDVVTDE